MDFTLSPQHEIFRRTVAEFVDKEVTPRVAEMEARREWSQDLFKRMGALGYFGLRYPEKYGGAGADTLMFAIFLEEMARGYMSLAAAAMMQCLMGTNFIYRFGTEEQRERLLVPAIRGEKIGTIAMTEPGAGSDLGAITTRAVREGDSYILDGTKSWITSATRADFFTVAAKTNPDPKAGFKGIDMFLVEKGTPGLTVGKKIDKVGVVASETSELSLKEVRVPVENLFGGKEGFGFTALREILNEIRVMTGALGLGLARAARDESIQYARQRMAFGKKIGDFQAIQHKLADIETSIELSRLTVHYGAWLIDQKMPCNKEAAIAKYYATEAAVKAADEATRIFGAYGMAMEMAPQRFFRDARFLLYGGGTSEVLRNIIAKEMGM
ncbi:MAG: acyl-CoA dehydrogenase family protein [Chloroflexota bacterium]|nr:acyl-CoA dehydrogenase family protein [Chloroflexota bacterium]